MRTLFMSIIVLTTMIITLSAPTPAVAYSNLIIFLAEQACSGQRAAYKNGCYAYLENRALQSAAPDTALSQCNTRCVSWYSTDPAVQSLCKQGCQFIRSKE